MQDAIERLVTVIKDVRRDLANGGGTLDAACTSGSKTPWRPYSVLRGLAAAKLSAPNDADMA